MTNETAALYNALKELVRMYEWAQPDPQWMNAKKALEAYDATPKQPEPMPSPQELSDEWRSKVWKNTTQKQPEGEVRDGDIIKASEEEYPLNPAYGNEGISEINKMRYSFCTGAMWVRDFMNNFKDSKNTRWQDNNTPDTPKQTKGEVVRYKCVKCGTFAEDDNNILRCRNCDSELFTTPPQEPGAGEGETDPETLLYNLNQCRAEIANLKERNALGDIGMKALQEEMANLKHPQPVEESEKNSHEWEDMYWMLNAEFEDYKAANRLSTYNNKPKQS